MKLLLSNSTEQIIEEHLFLNILKKLDEVIPDITHEQVELHITDNASIQTLNAKYRNKDTATDVLSFNLDDPITLGQIVISIEMAKEQAKDLVQSLNEELEFLFTHGLLHLLAYDHENPEDEKLMLAKAYQILDRPTHD